MTLSKSEACALLHISESTLQRRMRAGKYEFTKIGEGQYAEVRFTYAGLGLTQPTPEPTPEPVEAQRPAETTPETFAPRELTREERDAEFARDYLAGLASDSMGNTINGNPRWPTKGKQSLVAPVAVDDTPPGESQSHMNPALLSDRDNLGNKLVSASDAPTHGVTRSGRSLCPGISEETYNEMMNTYTRRFPNGRSEADQEKASRHAAENINNVFPRAQRR